LKRLEVQATNVPPGEHPGRFVERKHGVRQVVEHPQRSNRSEAALGERQLVSIGSDRWTRCLLDVGCLVDHDCRYVAVGEQAAEGAVAAAEIEDRGCPH